MSERAPRPINPLTPKEEVRKTRFRSNLENVQNADLKELYPPEMEHREWTEVTDKKELGQAREELRFFANDIPPELYGLYRDKDGEHSYFVR